MKSIVNKRIAEYWRLKRRKNTDRRDDVNRRSKKRLNRKRWK
jgi:hypothetical protein